MANSGTGEKKEKEPLDCGSEDILRSIYEKCKYESVHGLQRPLALYKERVIYYTGTEVPEEKNLDSQLDLLERAVINDSFKKLYSQQEPFSFTDIYAIVKDKIKIPDINLFCHILRKLGYKPVNTLNYGQIILEDQKLAFERFRYLNKLMKFRESGKTIYYLDERVIDFNKTFKKVWIQYKDMSEIDGYVYFHIVSQHGLEKGLFCNQANAEDFSKWVGDMVVSYIKASSVIIMDNSPLHGNAVNEPISRHHSKDEMLKWLQRNNIPCSPSMRKAHLYDLITRCPVKDDQYRLDLLFNSHGHEVLRLPENYHDLSMTELMWDHIRSVTCSMTASDLMNLKNRVCSEIKNIRPDKWVQFESTIIDTEKNVFAIDEANEQALELYDIDLKNAN